MWRMVSLLAFLLLMTAVCMLTFSCSQNATGDIVDDEEEEDDIIAPAAIVDLAVTHYTTSTVTLEWTAPGDDSTTGVAIAYDLRASYDTITDENFSEAYQFDDAPPPLPAGLTQSNTIEGLDAGQKYYFAIKTRDNMGNWSGLSNCVSVTCLTDFVVNFPDTALERVIRGIINKPSGDIIRSDLQDMVDLVAQEENISDLTGLEYCISLNWIDLFANNIESLTPLENMTWPTVLYLGMNNISDISPIAGMTDLVHLIVGQNPVSDLSPLSGMTKLQLLRLHDIDATDFSPIYGLTSVQELDMGSNQLADISFVTNLSHVKNLGLYGNGISDLTPLASLTGLEKLWLQFNQISDLTPLTGLINLTELNLGLNQVADILPLVNNTGFGEGDVVVLYNNPLSQQSIDEYIPALEARGVTVHWED
jgi:hypothetical protein